MMDAAGRFNVGRESAFAAPSRPRTAPLGALAMLAITAAHPGCDCADTGGTTASSSSSSSTTSSSTSSSSSGGGGSGGEGGAGGSGGALPSYDITQVTAALAFDATPNAEGNTIYFTGISGNGQIGVFKKAANGSGDIGALAVGAPFIAPFGIAAGTDNVLLYVADLGAADVAAGTDDGKIFRVSVVDGGVLPVPIQNVVLPRGLEIYSAGQNDDRIVFSGLDMTAGPPGQPGVFEVPTSGGVPTVLAEGSPLVDPGGVAVSAAGDVAYVCDTLSRADKTATVFVITRGVVNELVSGLHVGYPCGIALSRDDATLFALTRNAVTGKDEVAVIDVKSKAVTATVTDTIDAYDEPAGMHRAKSVDQFALVDSKAQDTGTVFLMQ